MFEKCKHFRQEQKKIEKMSALQLPICKWGLRNIMEKWQQLDTHTTINKRTFLKILQFCLNENNYFTFDNKFYQQLYGMPMGNPLSPTIADIVLDTLLDDVVNELQSKNIKIKFLTKYVDDLFAVINKSDVSIIQKTLNAYHQKIQFTVENEKDGTIHYLDMSVTNVNGKIITNWYSKPISSGRMINYHSTQPLRVKLNTATNFIKKVFQLSDDKYTGQNINKIRRILNLNNYPTYIINNLIQSYLKTKNKSEENDKTKKDTIFYSVPYIPKLTETKTLKNIISDNTATIAHKSNKTIRTLFSNNKTKLEKTKICNVVYEIPCTGNENESCNLVYIGTTKRRLGTRINEHKADTAKRKGTTALSLHAKEYNHKMDFENVTILDREKRANKRYTLESLRIQQKIQRTMNTKEDKDNTKLQYFCCNN